MCRAQAELDGLQEEQTRQEQPQAVASDLQVLELERRMDKVLKLVKVGQAIVVRAQLAMQEQEVCTHKHDMIRPWLGGASIHCKAERLKKAEPVVKTTQTDFCTGW